MKQPDDYDAMANRAKQLKRRFTEVQAWNYISHQMMLASMLPPKEKREYRHEFDDGICMVFIVMRHRGMISDVTSSMMEHRISESGLDLGDYLAGSSSIDTPHGQRIRSVFCSLMSEAVKREQVIKRKEARKCAGQSSVVITES